VVNTVPEFYELASLTNDSLTVTTQERQYDFLILYGIYHNNSLPPHIRSRSKMGLISASSQISVCNSLLSVIFLQKIA